MGKFCSASFVLLLVLCGTKVACAEPTFSFESVGTLDDMSSLIRSQAPLGSSRENVRHIFVEEGSATLKVKEGDSSIEKYIYDIDLCHYYIWRWNISVDFDASDQLLQAYVNGNIVFPNGNPKKFVPKVAEEGEKASIYRKQRPRPEAYKGERSLGFLLFDRDSDPSTTDDQALIGAGPSRADPMNLGKIVIYEDVEPWRSIFDFDSADHIVPYQGNCNTAI
ncbi:hypothetical protein E8F11_00625 [Pseudomonas sp. BN417]|uniref:hypothetical protein n=1 Tax=Pseudomonas sp. BN417 TaxID=2567890 RepID=UPI0024541022|nr:hypothetical protein [Pseudomonas sp. BN417]MDH4553693.1 hypothetical protein [Pseudomonas sp. BN417]